MKKKFLKYLLTPAANIFRNKESREQLIHKFRCVLDERLTNHLIQSNPLYHNNFSYSEINQKNIVSNWKNLKKQGLILDNPFEYGFRNFSQTNEDGILLYIFTMIGTTNKKLIEIGFNFEDSHTNIPEANSINLILYHGWTGLLCDAEMSNVTQGIHFFHLVNESRFYFFNYRKNENNYGAALFSPSLEQQTVTVDNINSIVSESNCSGEIDLLMIDIDSYDYHIWKEIEACNPRVVVLETDGGKIDYNTAVTIRRDARPSEITEFLKFGFSGSMSLRAACSLSKKKGYRLVAISSGGWNAFFIRNDVGQDVFPEISIEEAYLSNPSVYSLKERGMLWNFEMLSERFGNLFDKV